MDRKTRILKCCRHLGRHTSQSCNGGCNRCPLGHVIAAFIYTTTLINYLSCSCKFSILYHFILVASLIKFKIYPELGEDCSNPGSESTECIMKITGWGGGGTAECFLGLDNIMSSLKVLIYTVTSLNGKFIT